MSQLTIVIVYHSNRPDRNACDEHVLVKNGRKDSWFNSSYSLSKMICGLYGRHCRPHRSMEAVKRTELMAIVCYKEREAVFNGILRHVQG